MIDTRYVTAADAERLRQRYASAFVPIGVDFQDLLRARGIEYYVVPDDDPRLTTPAPDPPADAE